MRVSGAIFSLILDPHLEAKPKQNHGRDVQNQGAEGSEKSSNIDGICRALVRPLWTTLGSRGELWPDFGLQGSIFWLLFFRSNKKDGKGHRNGMDTRTGDGRSAAWAGLL